MTLSLADYFAFGAHKMPHKRGADREERSIRNEHMLCRALNLKTVVAFVGAGCSAAFGYPTWETFASEMIELTASVAPSKHRGTLGRFRGVLNRYKEKRDPCPSDRLTLFIDVCKSILAEEQRLDLYKDKVKTLFSLKDIKDCNPPHNPYHQLFNLDIRRFVTTNYDIELERNLIDVRKLHSDDDLLKGLGAKSRRARQGLLRSFSQTTKDYEQLALFALAKIRGNENAVFHCHGRFDDPDSLIASETDYQSWYFSDKDPSRRIFRQTIELLIESNPLLFVGYGLQDEELLRPLRHLSALDPQRRHSRPLFALVGWSGEDEGYDEVLYERYGVHVIPYTISSEEGSLGHSRALCDKLGAIWKRWHEDRDEWVIKPRVRTSGLGNVASKSYTGILTPAQVPVGKIADGADLAVEIQQPGLIGLLGPAGSGKSLRLLNLIDPCPDGFYRSFYWNAHYGSEFLSAFDDALAFFEAGSDKQESRHESMRRILRERKLLFVIDGCERFLYRTSFPEGIDSYSPAFSLWLRELDDPKMKSTVIFSGRLLPAELTAAAEVGSPPRRIRVLRVVTSDLERLPTFSRWPRDSASLTGLCSLLRGHNYGLRLADHYLNLQGDAKQPLERLPDLLQNLAYRPPDQRLPTMVRVFIDALDESGAGLVQAVLERMARFIGPICEETWRICYAAAVKEVRSESPKECSALLNQLLESELIFKMQRNGAAAITYCVHATARRMLLRPRHGLAADALPDFGISGFTSGRIDVDPDPEQRSQIEELFNAIMESGEKYVQEPAGHRQAADLCADAFALLRGTMAANTVPRWYSYDTYCAFGIRLARLLKAVCCTAPDLEAGTPPGTWRYCEYFDRDLIESTAAPLHVSELAWLYNDVGLALSAEGLLSDAYSVWEQAFEISRTMEHPRPGGGYRVEVLLNLTHVFIEMGRLREAPRYLEFAEDFNAKLQNADFAARILGFRGLLAHLSGNLPEADVLYRECTQALRGGNNLRAQSVFLKHYADLKMSMGDLDQAELLIRESRALAEAGNFPDLVAFARVSHGHLLAQRERYRDSRQEYQSLLQEAQRMGARKLEAECHSTLSRLCLQEGDVEGARVRAMKALSLANELGLGLRLAHAMVVLGLATIKAGQPDLGVAYLRNARRLASEQEYWHCGWQAQAALQELGKV
jgi:tetratricopeptide (TPR) repeat protein